MPDTRTAVIVGSAGQDGRLLFEFLQRAGTTVIGITRPTAASEIPKGDSRGSRLLDILDARQVSALIADVQPDEVYYLAAFHHASEDARPDSSELYHHSHQVHVEGLLNFLDAMKRTSAKSRLFYAASSHIFGSPVKSPQDENTPIEPRCIYGITKASGIHLCRFYRESHGAFASAGILYTHESPFRRRSFLASKVINAAIEIRAGQRNRLAVGDLSAQIDWGYAPDYVEAMVKILALPHADDFVIATGRLLSVGAFIEIVFQRLGLDWHAHVVEDPSIIVRRRSTLVGDPSKLRRATGWSASTDPGAMVDHLLRARGVKL